MNTIPSTQHMREVLEDNIALTAVICRFDAQGRVWYSQDGVHWGTLRQSFAHVDKDYIARCKEGHVAKAWF